MEATLFKFWAMNKGVYNFLANYQWYFVGVFAYLFVRGYWIIKDIPLSVQVMNTWYVISGLITLFTEIYFFIHKDYRPKYQVPYIVLFILVTILIVEMSQYR